MEMRDFGRVGVLMGGPSSEKEISLKSGNAVLSALRDKGINAVAVEIKNDDFKQNLRMLKKQSLDCAFIALHGYFGEDGQIQAILERIKIPYTGSRVKASRLAMDKIASLQVFQEQGLNVPKTCFLDKRDYRRLPDCAKELGMPLIVKPANHGSSIGLTVVHRNDDLQKAISLAFEYDRRLVIQEFIRGREVTVGVLNKQALPVIEIIPKKQFFDFEAKYKSSLTDYIIPARLEGRLALRLQQAALLAHKSFGCSGCSRSDMIVAKNAEFYMLEVNTIPGMTSSSLLPKAAQAAGIDFAGLCLQLLELAYEKK